MSKNNDKNCVFKKEEILTFEKTAMDKALKQIEKCRVTHSKTLIIRNPWLTALPEELRKLSWLKRLYIVDTAIRVLPGWIGELENLETFDISRASNICKLPPSLVKLKKLKNLIIDLTGLTKLPSFIGKLHSLELLDLIMPVKEVPQSILDLPKLKCINTHVYYDNIVGSYPSNLVAKQHELNVKEFFRRINQCKKNKSKKLNLSYLHIEKLPKEFSDLYWLEELDLECNRLKQLPEWICNFSKLKVLNLYRNDLKQLPDSISNLANLNVFDLSHNKLMSLPNSIGNLSKLKKIILSDNRLKTLPETFCKLKSLEEFTLEGFFDGPYLKGIGKAYGYRNNPCFSSLPESFGNLSSLKIFEVSCTKLTELPESFGNLKSLNELTIQCCETKDFHFPKSMKKLKTLRYVDLSSGAFDKVPDFINELKELNILDIQGNSLYILPEFLGNLKKLKFLNLKSTKINKLPEWVGNLKNLVELDISHNSIEVDPKIKKNLPKLKKYDDSLNYFNPHKEKRKQERARKKGANMFYTAHPT